MSYLPPSLPKDEPDRMTLGARFNNWVTDSHSVVMPDELRADLDANWAKNGVGPPAYVFGRDYDRILEADHAAVH